MAAIKRYLPGNAITNQWQQDHSQGEVSFHFDTPLEFVSKDISVEAGEIEMPESKIFYFSSEIIFS
ncbi:MAG: hypothetical protein GX294_01650 [Candidatus Cloacimonetes bacterium]|nr:hypothetical protein [Candidatus Cloacimonadota bacterium]